MKLTLIILNLVAAVLVFPAMRASETIALLRVSSGYTELDRAGVINRDKLKELFPRQADNDRYEMPKLMLMRGSLSASQMIGIPCMMGFLLNAILIGAFWKKQVPNKSLKEMPSGDGAPQL